MRTKREISAIFEQMQSDSSGALDCVLHVIEMLMRETVSEERGTRNNESSTK